MIKRPTKIWLRVALLVAGIGLFAAIVAQVWYGTDASIGWYPYVVSVENSSSEHRCGGILFSDGWVLTAAHCGLPAGAQIRANSDTMTSAIHTGGVVRKVKSQCVHPDFYGAAGIPFRADLQMLAIEPLGADAPTKFAKVASVAGSKVRVIGWGTTQSGNYPTKLQKATVATVDDTTCNKEHAKFATKLLPEHLCFGEPPKGSCNGDSGGPVLNRWSKSEVVAIVSGNGSGTCGQAKEWTVGAELAHYESWIANVLAGTLDCQ